MGIWKGGRSLRTLLGVQARVPTGLEPLWALGGDLRTSRQTGCPQGRGAARPGPPRPPTTFSLPPRPLPPPGQPRPCSVRSNLFWAGPAARGGFQLFLHALLHRKAHSLPPPSLLLHTHTHTHTYTHTQRHVHTHTHTRRNTRYTHHIHVQKDMHIHIRSDSDTYIHTRHYSHIHTHTQRHTHIYTHRCYTHTHSHTHIYTHREENMFTHRDTYITHTRADTYMCTHRDTYTDRHTAGAGVPCCSDCANRALASPAGGEAWHPGVASALPVPHPGAQVCHPSTPSPPPTAVGPAAGSGLASPGSVLSVCPCGSVLFLAFEMGMSWCRCGFDLHFPGD